MERKNKNVKISETHHEILKTHCDANGLKIYRVIEKWIDDLNSLNPRGKKKDIYGE
jgi:coproporphyrinogen III oxidase